MHIQSTDDFVLKNNTTAINIANT